jgi:hypothetical protein
VLLRVPTGRARRRRDRRIDQHAHEGSGPTGFRPAIYGPPALRSKGHLSFVNYTCFSRASAAHVNESL